MFTTEILQTLAQNGNIGEVFRSHLEKAVNTLLAQELTAFLDYEKYDRIGFNFGNSRNGVYERTLHMEYGDLKLEIPRDRNGDFRQQTIAPTESVHVWRELLEDFRERRMEEVLLFISDGLKGMETMLSEIYPHTLSCTLSSLF